MNGIAESREPLYGFRGAEHAETIRPAALAFVESGGNGLRDDGPAPPAGPAEKAGGRFDFASILRLRTFVYLFAGTVFLVFYIHNILTINDLSRQNEMLREKIGISRSINTSLEIELQELHTIHKISGQAEAMGLRHSMTPAVKISAR